MNEGVDDMELPMSLDDLEEYFINEMGEDVSEIEKELIKKGVEETPLKIIWMTVERGAFREAVKAVSEIQTPHLSVASGSDKDDIIELIYHFQVNYSYPGEETSINIKVHLPKDDPTIPTITDMVPGAITTEREKQEFLGVDVEDIPDSRRLWLDEKYPEDKYPWRWDDKGLEEMSRYVHDPAEAPKEPTAQNMKKEDEDQGGED